MTTSPEMTASPADVDAPGIPAPPATGKARTPLVVTVLVAATFTVILNETIMTNAVPRLMTDFRVSPRTAQWLSTVFMLTMAALIPVTGWFLQRVTTRTAYAVAMATFCVGTVIGAVAPVFAVLLVGRVVQASGTAVMLPLLMTTLMTVVPESDRGRVMGTVTMAMSCAPALGPAVSGLILQVGSWRLIFVFMLPVAAAVAVAGLRLLENVGEPQPGSVNWTSVALAALGFGGLLFGLSEAGALGVLPVALIIAGGAALVAAFAWLQVRLVRTSGPLLDLRTLRHRDFRVSLVLIAALHLAFLGTMFLLPLYLQDTRGLTSLQTGLLLIPGGLAMGVLGPPVGRLYDRFGARPVVLPGAVGAVVGLGALSQLGHHTSYWLLLAAHVVLMASLAVVITPVFTAALGDLPAELYAHGSSLLGTVIQVAGALGTALLVVISQTHTAALTRAGVPSADAFVAGLRWAFTAGGACAVVMTALAFLLPGRPGNRAGAAEAVLGAVQAGVEDLVDTDAVHGHLGMAGGDQRQQLA
jgi:DHA2 family lincomycin resistance protein-like MFS transporter